MHPILLLTHVLFIKKNIDGKHVSNKCHRNFNLVVTLTNFVKYFNKLEILDLQTWSEVVE